MFSKGIKTTVVAIIGAVLGISTFIMWYLGKVDNEGLAIGLAGIASFTTTLGLLFAKDADRSHTERDNDLVGGRPDDRG